MSHADLIAWTAYYREAESALDDALAAEARIWVSEGTYSEGYREAAERTACAAAHWGARLTAYNAYMDAQAAA